MARPREHRRQAGRAGCGGVASVSTLPGPGFINLRLAVNSGMSARGDRCAAGWLRRYGRRAPSGGGVAVNVDMSRPIRPGRCMSAMAAARWSAMPCRTCSPFAGFTVTREYYVNDAGAQVDVLARSGLSALSRGTGRGHRQNLPRASIPAIISSRSAQRSPAQYKGADKAARGRMAPRRSCQGDRDDDGDGACRPRRAQYRPRRVLFGALDGRRRHRPCGR